MIYSCIYINLYSATESRHLFFFSQVRSLLSPYPSHHLKSCSSLSSNLTSGTASQAQSHLPWPPSPRSLSYSQHTLTESYSKISSDILSSPSTESYGQSGEQDDYPDATSFPRGQVEGTTLGLVVMETQGQSVVTQKAPRKRQQNLQKQLKKRKDMEWKRAQRFDDGKTFEKICELLKILARPKKTLVCRSA